MQGNVRHKLLDSSQAVSGGWEYCENSLLSQVVRLHFERNQIWDEMRWSQPLRNCRWVTMLSVRTRSFKIWTSTVTKWNLKYWKTVKLVEYVIFLGILLGTLAKISSVSTVCLFWLQIKWCHLWKSVWMRKKPCLSTTNARVCRTEEDSCVQDREEVSSVLSSYL